MAETWWECHLCQGKGWWRVDGKQETCPNCGGSGEVRKTV